METYSFCMYTEAEAAGHEAGGAMREALKYMTKARGRKTSSSCLGASGELFR